MRNPKHAYLIMAHDNWSILVKLLQLLDDPRHDIYLHLDAKSYPHDLNFDFLCYSQLFIIGSKPVYWADYSQVETELRLLKEASTNEYSYYHLLSGVDLPLKTNDTRYNFFEHSKKNFIGIVPHESFYSVRRVKYYHLFLHNSLYRKCKLLKAFDRILEYLQRIIGIDRLGCNSWKIIDGWQWFSIRHELCMLLIHSERNIRKIFQYSIASDELFIQTYVYNIPGLRETLYDETDLKKGSMRYIDWQRGKPYIFGGNETEHDLNLLMNSPYMFARKFTEEHSSDLVDRIYRLLMTLQDNNTREVKYKEWKRSY